MQGPARLWEKVLLSLNVAGSEAGTEGEEIAPLAKENVATPWEYDFCFVSKWFEESVGKLGVGKVEEK